MRVLIVRPWTASPCVALNNANAGLCQHTAAAHLLPSSSMAKPTRSSSSAASAASAPASASASICSRALLAPKSTSAERTPGRAPSVAFTLTEHAVQPMPETRSSSDSSVAAPSTLGSATGRSVASHAAVLPAARRPPNAAPVRRCAHACSSSGKKLRRRVSAVLAAARPTSPPRCTPSATRHVASCSSNVSESNCGRTGPSQVLKPPQPSEREFKTSCSTQQLEDSIPIKDHHSRRNASDCSRSDSCACSATPCTHASLLCHVPRAKQIKTPRLDRNRRPKPGSQIRCSRLRSSIRPNSFVWLCDCDEAEARSGPDRCRRSLHMGLLRAAFVVTWLTAWYGCGVAGIIAEGDKRIAPGG
mmetsp:Transcript_36306/g.76400  ORF Transcript_36306/g.76400 Transcript_36306/m.76400 type:complete len:360 (+) Transcript_36306:262-1341(+)